MAHGSEPVRVGMIANPVSARDVRRVLSDAAGLTLGERVAMLLRVLRVLASMGVDEVLLMPEREGLRALLDRQLLRESSQVYRRLPTLRWLDMTVSGSVVDTLAAASLMRDQGVRALMVMGGDGTHRAVASVCRDVPIVGISTGTNNAFPPMREVTVTAMATALYVRGRIPEAVAVRNEKRLDVRCIDTQGARVREDIALIDVGVLNERILGAKAIGDAGSLHTILVTQASPEAVGLSGVAAMLQPVGRHEPGGLMVRLGTGDETLREGQMHRAPWTLHAALAPGLITAIPVRSWRWLPAGEIWEISGQDGLLSLDGEREMAFRSHERVEICLHDQGLKTLDVPACLHYAAREHLLLEHEAAG